MPGCYRGLLAGALLAGCFSACVVQAQAVKDDTANSAQSPYTIRVTTREVVIEVVAMDRHHRPVNDLQESEFQVFEVGKRSQKSEQKILAFRKVDSAGKIEVPPAGLQVTAGGGCAVRNVVHHYEIAIAASAESGYHEILITTGRPHVTLAFRRRYYVGETALPAATQPQSGTKIDQLLQQAACYHAGVPDSISLTGRLVKTGRTDTIRYSLSIQGDSLAFISLSDQMRRVQLDYGVCTFDAAGMQLKYLHTSVVRALTEGEYERDLVDGFPNLLEMPASEDIALIRFVVRDRATGNLGSVDVVRPSPEEEAKKRHSRPPMGSLRAFGSIVPSPGAFCGDVYELPEGTSYLPYFWDLDPIGSVYADTLNVPSQNITHYEGIPGVTNRVDWFGIDYYGEFWIETPGDYGFRLSADDGAILYIDDEPVINVDGAHQVLSGEGQVTLSAGRHVMHVPYFQGPPVSVALVLEMKPPGGEFKVFDLRKFGVTGKAERGAKRFRHALACEG